MGFYGASDDLNWFEKLYASYDAKYNRGATSSVSAEEKAAAEARAIPSGYYLDPNGDYAYSWYAPTAAIQIVWSKAKGHYRAAVSGGTTAWAAIVNKALAPSTRTKLSEAQMKALPDPAKPAPSAPLVPAPEAVGEPEGLVAQVQAFYANNPNALPLTVAAVAVAAGAAIYTYGGSGSRASRAFGRTNPGLWE